MSKIAVFPGSFDPFTVGHQDILVRALPLFDKIIVALGINSQKKTLYPLKKRLEFINVLFENEPKVSTATYSGLTARFCEKEGVNFLIRGLRSSADFEYEKTIAQLNKAIAPKLETVFLISSPQHSHISSTIVREIIMNDGDAKAFLPEKMRKLL